MILYKTTLINKLRKMKFLLRKEKLLENKTMKMQQDSEMKNGK